MSALDLVDTWPVDAAAVGVLAGAGPAGSRPVLTGAHGPTGRRFPWASVTKPVTALAVLVAVEEGTLALDMPAGPPGSTVRHLLAHASGLGLDGTLPPVPPGTRRIYSNAGYGVLAGVLAERSGMAFHEYLAEGVLGPLGMGATTIDPVSVRGGDSGAAAGLVGPLDDLLALAGELLSPRLVSAETHALATSVAFAGLAGVLPGFGRFDPCDWGLGVEIRGSKQPHWTGAANSPGTFGHFGQSGSFLWVDPAVGVACAGLADRPFGPWAAEAWPVLAEAVLADAALAEAVVADAALAEAVAGMDQVGEPVEDG